MPHTKITKHTQSRQKYFNKETIPEIDKITKQKQYGRLNTRNQYGLKRYKFSNVLNDLFMSQYKGKAGERGALSP
jgi:hypothetical protein